MTIQELRKNNPIWFGSSNKKFFKDIDYRVLRDYRIPNNDDNNDKKSKYALVRSMYNSSYLLGDKEKIIWVINPLTGTKIEFMIDNHFNSLNDIKNFLRGC